jgi:hypothetical protein
MILLQLSVPACLLACMQQVCHSEGFYRFSLQLAPYSGNSTGAFARTWHLGVHTNDLRREWLEALVNASLPTAQQVGWASEVVPDFG